MPGVTRDEGGYAHFAWRDITSDLDEEEALAKAAEKAMRKRLNDPAPRVKDVVLSCPCSRVDHFKAMNDMLMLPGTIHNELPGPATQPMARYEKVKAADREILPRLLVDRMVTLAKFMAGERAVMREVRIHMAQSQLETALIAWAQDDFQTAANTAAAVVGMTVGSLETVKENPDDPELKIFEKGWKFLTQFFYEKQLLDLCTDHERIHGPQGMSVAIRERFAGDLGLIPSIADVSADKDAKFKGILADCRRVFQITRQLILMNPNVNIKDIKRIAFSAVEQGKLELPKIQQKSYDQLEGTLKMLGFS